jgi:hypothetical protein
MNQREQFAAALCSRWFLAHGLFYPEDGGDIFLKNVGAPKIYAAPHPRRRAFFILTAVKTLRWRTSFPRDAQTA